ncbi:hypothetical protein IGI04_003102 [Brassica rapa subsp. trilocularis]|uniref:PLD phosphodiesterase domain-containing protein n=1 Tax=Brassica rapa subsp. trilocularis TaxID=1813537 RepID=A0ABQ7NXG7_BRACM|nr:hypothetical protein IGI04_003102 [Brassica rapa subsp. trilocularis]
MQLHEKLLVFDEDRKVIVAGSLNPKLVGGRPGNSMLVKKIKSLTLSELNAYVITSPPEAAEFLCTLEIDNIETSNAWCYISCSKRSRKLQRGFFMFTVPHRYSREELNTPAEAFRI